MVRRHGVATMFGNGLNLEFMSNLVAINVTHLRGTEFHDKQAS